METRELAKSLIDKIPENRLFCVISYLQGAAIPDEIPNVETLATFEELKNGGGEKFAGSTDDLFKELSEA